MRINYQHKKGFTLLEILVALFIFTIIAIIMTHALHTVLDIQAVTDKRAARLSELQLATLLLSRDIEQMIDRPIINNEGRLESSLVGATNAITFTHAGLDNPLGQLTRATLQRTRYTLENKILTRTIWPVLDQVATSKPSQRHLLNDVSALQFRYLDEEGHYNDRWPPANRPKAAVFPRAIKISITLPHWGDINQIYIIPGRNLGF
jgi:general secretion pathway protein J